MKELMQFLIPTVKAFMGAIAFLIGLGWAAYASIYLIVDAKGKEIKSEVREIRNIDMDHINKRFDRIEILIQENK